MEKKKLADMTLRVTDAKVLAERIAELERELAEARESNTKLLLVAQEWKRNWLKSPVFQTFVDLKHGIVGDVLCALQEGEISRSKAAECLAEIAHGATEVRLPRYRGYFAEDETPVEKCERLEAINKQLVEALEGIFKKLNDLIGKSRGVAPIQRPPRGTVG